MAGTAAYMLVPYRLLDLYLRAAVGEYTAMVFLPAVVYGLYLIYSEKQETGNKGWLWLSFGFSGLILSHVISTFMVGLFTFLVCIIKIKETLRKEVLLQFIKAVVCTVLVNLWFLLPFLEYMQFEYKMSEPWIRFTAHGTFLSQLTSFFPHGEGASIATGKLWDTDSGMDMSYTLGGGVMLALVLYMTYSVYTRKERKDTNGHTMLHLHAGFCILALYMSTLWFPWDFLQQKSSLAAWVIGNIQYPWRFLTISSVTGAFVTALLVRELKGGFRQAALIAMGILSLVSAVYFMQDYIRCGEERNIDAKGVSSWWVGRAEYMPAGADKSTFAEENGLFWCGDGLVIEGYEKGAGTVRVTCVNTGEGETYVDVPVLYYKGYAAEDIGTKEPLLVTETDSGRARVVIPEGYEGIFAVAFKSPWYWRVSEAVSLFTVIWFAALVYRRRRNGKRVRNTERVWQKKG